MILNDRRNRPDPYRLAAQALGVQPGAGEDDVKKAYRSTAQKFHPDRHAGEGKDEVYAARFNLATCAKTLLLARGSADERKALDAFNKAKLSYDDELRKAGIKPEPAAEAPRAAPAQPSARPRAEEPCSDFYTRRPSGATRGPGFENAKKWTPPEFDTSGQKWNGKFWQSAAGPSAKASSRPDDGFQPFSFRQEQPQQEAPRASAGAQQRSAGPRPQPGAQAQQEPARASAAPQPETVRPTPSSTATVSPLGAATAQPQTPPDPRARAAAAAYADAMSGFTKGSSFDRWV